MIAQRVEKLRARLREQGLDALLVSGERNVAYLSGYTNHEAFLYLSQSGENILITDSRYVEQARAECPDYRVLLYGGSRPGLPQTLALLNGKCHVKRLGFEAEFVNFARYQQLAQALPHAELVGVSDLVEQLRYVKDAGEIAVLEEACARTDLVFAALCRFIRAGRSEAEVEWELYRLIHEQDCVNSFHPIVASGTRGSMPHAVAMKDKILCPGELLTIDMGCRYHGYNADITRTVCLGQPDAEQRRRYDIVLQANLRAQAALRPGMTASSVDAVARDYIASFGYGDNFGHGLGHGVGLDIHEQPSLNPRCDRVLEPGCLVTVEPGMYFPGWGGVRIEDTVLVTDQGCRSLFTSSKELLCL